MTNPTILNDKTTIPESTSLALSYERNQQKKSVLKEFQLLTMAALLRLVQYLLFNKMFKLSYSSLQAF